MFSYSRRRCPATTCYADFWVRTLEQTVKLTKRNARLFEEEAKKATGRDPSGLVNHVDLYPANPAQIAWHENMRQKMKEAAELTEMGALAIKFWTGVCLLLILAYLGGELYGLSSTVALIAAGFVIIGLARLVLGRKKD